MVLTSKGQNSHEMVLKNFCQSDIQITLTRKSFDGMILDQRRISLGREREKAFPLEQILPPVERSFIEVDATQPVGLSLSTSMILLSHKVFQPPESLNQ